MSPMVSVILTKAEALVDTPDKWARGAIARDVTGREVCVDDGDAVAFCPIGAISRCSVRYDDGWLSCLALQVLKEAIGAQFVDDWNDAPERTHADIVAGFRRAIALATKETV